MGFSSIGGKFKGGFFGSSTSKGDGSPNDSNSARSGLANSQKVKTTENLTGNNSTSMDAKGGKQAAAASKTENKAKPQTMKISKVLA